MNDVRNPCQIAVYIEGSAREGTAASAYDPLNVMGGARYRECGREGYTKDDSGRWLCESHSREWKSFKKQLDKQKRNE